MEEDEHYSGWVLSVESPDISIYEAEKGEFCPFVGRIEDSLTKASQDENGVYVFSISIPTSVKLPLIATEEDTGPFTKALVSVEPGKNLIAYRSWMSLDEYLEIIGRVKGVKMKNVLPPPDAEVDTGMPAELAEEMSDNAKYFEEFGYEARDDPSVLHPKDVSVPTSEIIGCC